MSTRRKQGRLKKLDHAHKVKRQEKRMKKKTWGVRVWARKHIRGEA